MIQATFICSALVRAGAAPASTVLSPARPGVLAALGLVRE